MEYEENDPLTQKVVRCIPPPVLALLHAFPEAQLSGGFVRDALVGDPYKDIDIYFDLAETAAAAGLWVETHLGIAPQLLAFKFEFELDVVAPNTNNTLIMFEPRKVQLIHGYAIKDFDLYCCQNTYSPTRGLHVDLHTLNHIVGLSNPTPGTLLRMYKLIRRGWECGIHDLVIAAQHYREEDVQRCS